MFFAIILVIGAIALAAYSYFRLNRRTIGFQHFEVRQRKTGPWGWGSTLKPSPGSGLLQQTGCFLAEHLAHFSCLLDGASALKRSAVAAPGPSTWLNQRMEEGEGQPVALHATGVAWSQIHQGPRRPLTLEESQDKLQS